MGVNKNQLLLVVVLLAIGIVGMALMNRVDVVDPPQVTPEVTPEVEVEVPKPKTFSDALDSIKEDEIKKNLYYLASDDLEGRMTGKRGHRKAEDFVKKKCEEWGLNVMFHKFTSKDIGRRISGINPGPNREVGDDWCNNVYAWVEGNDPELKDEIVVVGAHLDHVGYGPSMSRGRTTEVHHGADDNASGSTALLAMAKAVSILKGKNKRTIVFQWYSAEEMGLHGSRFYCNNPKFPINSPSMTKHVAMVNLDMVGYLGKGAYFAGFHGGDSSVDISRIIDGLNSKYAFAKQITSRKGGGSDHASFYNKRVPVAFLHTGLHRYYHTPDDTADKIDYQGVEQVSKYCFDLIWQICQSEKTPVFDHASFEEMEYTHDHGHPESPFGGEEHNHN